MTSLLIARRSAGVLKKPGSGWVDLVDRGAEPMESGDELNPKCCAANCHPFDVVVELPRTWCVSR